MNWSGQQRLREPIKWMASMSPIDFFCYLVIHQFIEKKKKKFWRTPIEISEGSSFILLLEVFY